MRELIGRRIQLTGRPVLPVEAIKIADFEARMFDPEFTAEADKEYRQVVNELYTDIGGSE